MKFRIGHPSYTAMATGYAQALRILLSRGVDMRAAHHALQAARAGSYATCSRMATMPSGRRIGVETIEVCTLEA